jgi:hypothetical protein
MDSLQENLDIKFNSLWNSTEEERTKLKDMKIELILKGFREGLMSADSAIELINAMDIYDLKLDKDDYIEEELDEEEQ